MSFGYHSKRKGQNLLEKIELRNAENKGEKCQDSLRSNGRWGCERIQRTRRSIEEAVWSSIHNHWFYTAEHPEVCKGKLQEEFGYHVVTKAAEEVLEGTYKYVEDFDKSTRDIMKECARIRSKIP